MAPQLDDLRSNGAGSGGTSLLSRFRGLFSSSSNGQSSSGGGGQDGSAAEAPMKRSGSRSPSPQPESTRSSRGKTSSRRMSASSTGSSSGSSAAEEPDVGAGIGFLSPPPSSTSRSPSPAATIAQTIDEFFFVVSCKTNNIAAEQYCAFHTCMFRALRTKFDEADAAERARADFLADSGDQAGVSKPRFAKMMQTLADRWTCVDGVSRPDMAASFLTALFLTVTYLDVGRPPCRRLLPWSSVKLGSCIPKPPESKKRTILPPLAPTLSISSSPRAEEGESSESSDEESDPARLAPLRRFRRLSDGGQPSSPPVVVPPRRRRSSTGEASAFASQASGEQLGRARSDPPSLSLRRYAVLNSVRMKALNADRDAAQY